MENLKTVSDVERYAAEQGIVFSSSEKAKILEAQEAELKRLVTLTPIEATEQSSSWADRWNGFYPRLLSAVISIGETLLTFSQTLITSLGVPVALVLLLIVEHHRVVEGIMLFDSNSTFAGFAAFALVLLNLVLELQIHYIEHKHNYKSETARRWSLRLWARNMRYRLGLGSDWTPQDLSPASEYKGTLTLVTFTILALALVGSMRGVIEQTGGTWYQALGAIITDSSLLLMMTWAGGLLFALAAVISAQRLSRYVAIRTVEIVAQMNQREATKTSSAKNPHAAAVEQAGATFAIGIIQMKKDKADAKKKEQQVPSPLAIAPVPMTMYSNGNGQHSSNGHHPTSEN